MDRSTSCFLLLSPRSATGAKLLFILSHLNFLKLLLVMTFMYIHTLMTRVQLFLYTKLHDTVADVTMEKCIADMNYRDGWLVIV